MKKDLLRAGKYLLLPTLGLASVMAFMPERLGLAVWIYALMFCGLTLALALAALRRAYPLSTPLRPRAPGSAQAGLRPPSLMRLEREVALGVAGAFDFHYHVHPRLRALAGELLAVRRGVSLDGQPETARRLLGDETWELLRPDRPRPEDRRARGLPPGALRRVIESLERI
jgi:hypothetical protein